MSRGRSASHKSSMDETTNLVKRTSVHGYGPQAGLSGDFTSDAINITSNNPSFTRSRSSASARQPIHLLASRTRCHVSPMNTEVMKQRTSDPITLFPAFLDLRLHFPFTSWTFTINVDLRKLGESVLLLGTLVHAVSHLESFPEVDFFPKTMSDVHYWLTTGKCLILLFLFFVTECTCKNYTISVLHHAYTLPGYMHPCPGIFRLHCLSRSNFSPRGQHPRWPRPNQPHPVYGRIVRTSVSTRVLSAMSGCQFRKIIGVSFQATNLFLPTAV